MTSYTLKELYLPSTGLYTKEAETLQRFLVNNTHLKVLDISNNYLGDRGLEALAKGLCNQASESNPNTEGMGLSVLIIFNNQITEKSGAVIKNIIVSEQLKFYSIDNMNWGLLGRVQKFAHFKYRF